MDLDLIEDDDLFVPTSPAVRAVEDPLRLSMLRLSIRTDSAAATIGRVAALAAAAAGPLQPAAGADVAGTSAGVVGGLTFSLPVNLPGRPDLHGDGTPPHVGQAGPEAAVASGVGGHEPAKHAGNSPGQALEAAMHSTEECSTVASITASVAPSGDDHSPLVIGAAHLDPMAALPTGSERLSSARPRRLTFAAAVSADSSSMMGYGAAGQVHSPDSSDAGSHGTAGGDTAASSRQRQQVPPHTGGQSMMLLRQRFLEAQLKQ